MRKRVAIEMLAKHERALRSTARRYSMCAADAEDAFQRALEILLTKAPPGEARELVRWMQTVTKHEALAVRRGRERQLSPALPSAHPEAGEEPGDLLSLLPSTAPGPEERAERREAIARSREALKTLKAAELRALTLLAEGYSYAEIGEITGFSQTKVNRCLAEGRERFRSFLSRSESGERCRELAPVLSAFCDGETGPKETAAIREHLRVCAHCRSVLRAYRAAPGAAAALLPAPLAVRTLLDRLAEAARTSWAKGSARLPGPWRGGPDPGQLAAAGGARGVGAAAAAKLVAACAGAVGTAAVCVGAGVVAPPFAGVSPDRAVAAHVRPAAAMPTPAGRLTAPEGPARDTARRRTARPSKKSREPAAPEQLATSAVEYEAAPSEPAPEVPAPAPEPPPSSEPPAPEPPESPSPAGEFGP